MSGMATSDTMRSSGSLLMMSSASCGLLAVNTLKRVQSSEAISISRSSLSSTIRMRYRSSLSAFSIMFSGITNWSISPMSMMVWTGFVRSMGCWSSICVAAKASFLMGSVTVNVVLWSLML